MCLAARSAGAGPIAVPRSTSGGSLAEGSSADGFSVGVEAGGWEELGSVVGGVEADFPGGGVDDRVVVAAQEHEVVQGGDAAVGPVLDVVGVAGDRGPAAGGERAVPV